MASWRDSASPQAQADLDGLVSSSLPFAQKMLGEHGEFYPYGMVVTLAGATEIFGADPGGSDRPASAEVRALLVDGIRSSRDRFRAAAVCADVRLPDSDAVLVAAEHREGPALNVFLPYKKKRFGRGVDYGDQRASQGQGEIWGTQ